MLSLPSSIRIFVARDPVDFRKAHDGLLVDGGSNPHNSGGLPGIWFFLKQRSSWVWFLATAAKVSAAGFGGCSPPRRSLQGAATIRPVKTEARRTA